MAERQLIEEIAAAIGNSHGEPARILNIGAGTSTVIEEQLTQAGAKFICDRLDVIDCRAEHPAVGSCWTCPAETMAPAPSGAYAAAFANFVLEHVSDVRTAAREICRVLSPGGRFVATVPNPSAPGFVLARHSPAWFRAVFTRRKPYKTCYAYPTIPALAGLLAGGGLRTVGVKFSCCAEDYLAHLPPLHLAGRLYDRALTCLQAVGLMGHACIVMEKPAWRHRAGR